MFNLIIYQKLASYKASCHNHPRPESSEETSEACFPAKSDKAGSHGSGRTVPFVNLRNDSSKDSRRRENEIVTWLNNVSAGYGTDLGQKVMAY